MLYSASRTALRRAPTVLRRAYVPCRQFSSKFLKVSEEVEEAVHAKRPVVALESAIYTHGFPYPENVALARQVEDIVRNAGAVPATICILDGIAHVGLSDNELNRIASSAGNHKTLKASRRDLPYLTGMRTQGVMYNGGTTIAGTMVLAKLAGIKVFATGGLGGVHRGAERTFDISADLTELGRTNVAVVSAGSKAFLDLEKTLEYLETQGVFIGTFGSRNERVEIPAFYSRNSGLLSPNVVETAKEAASIIHASHSLGLTSGQLFCNPIPEEYEIPKSSIDKIINQAVSLAEAEGVVGKDNTPFILNEIKKLTKGSSLPANTALVLNNARMGAEIAVELMELEGGAERSSGVQVPVLNREKIATTRPWTSVSITKDPEPKSKVAAERPPEVVVVGGLAVDTTCTHKPRAGTSSTAPGIQTSNPGTVHESIGGVGHNIAYAAHLMGARTRLITAVGPDPMGQWAVQHLSQRGMDTAGIAVAPTTSGFSTARYISVNDSKGELFTAIADMDIMEKFITPELASTALNSLPPPPPSSAHPQILALDTNLSQSTLLSIIRTSTPAHPRILALDPTSTPKSTILASLLPHLNLHPNPTIHLLTPNASELLHISQTLAPALLDSQAWFSVINALDLGTLFRAECERVFARQAAGWVAEAGYLQSAIRLAPVFPCVLVKFGEKGVLAVRLVGEEEEARLKERKTEEDILVRSQPSPSGRTPSLWVRYFPVPEDVRVDQVGSVSGAGDTFLGAVLAGLAKGVPLEKCVTVGMHAAAITVKHHGGVSAEIENLKGLLLK